VSITYQRNAFTYALAMAKTDYTKYPNRRTELCKVLAWLEAHVHQVAPAKQPYDMATWTPIVGSLHGHYLCMACGHRFGENSITPNQSRRAYLSLACPYCLHTNYIDTSR